MDRLELEDIKKTSFEVLLQIKDVCEKNNISYSLTGGTLLGAVRHKGFIPWDDDVDIMLPRPDYEKLMEIGKKEELPFILLSEEICGEKYPYPFAKGCHKDTILYEKATVKSEIELGVYVDIFPIDGMGNSEVQAKRHSRIFQFIYGLKVVSNWKNYQRSRRRKWYFEFFRFVCYLIGKLLSKKYINKLLNKSINKYSYSESNYAGRLVGDRGTKEVTKKTVFEKLQLMKFETQEFSVISDYDIYLTNLYGDYMQMPPKEKQITHHEFDAYWRK